MIAGCPDAIERAGLRFGSAGCRLVHEPSMSVPSVKFTDWLGSVSFRTKFLLFGLLLAGPLAVAAGFALATFGQQVETAKRRIDALQHGERVRALLLTVARHRGLSTTLQSGAEDQSTALVATQRQLERDLQAFVASFSPLPWSTVAPPLAALSEELRALMKLPETRSEQANFRRHTAITEDLLATSRRIGGMFGIDADDASAYSLTFVELPALLEALGRQRGWGSAMLEARQYAEPEVNQYLRYAGGAQLLLQAVRADPAALAALAQLSAPGAGITTEGFNAALEEAVGFSERSMALIRDREQSDSAAADHFRDGTRAIEALAAINSRLSQALEQRALAEQHEASERRTASLVVLLLLTALLAVVYLAFLRSTVDRLHALERSSQRLAEGDFDAAIAVKGRDEIARLAAMLDSMRERLREAVAERARGLAAQQADRNKTEFLARWSHDLRTPLNAIVGFSQVLEDRAPLSPEQSADLRQMRAAAAHMLNLVNDVLEVATTPLAAATHRLLPVELVPAVVEAIEMMRPTARRAGVDIALHLAADAKTGRVLGDRTRLLQLLANVIGNAVKFNYRAGRVDVLVGREAADAADAPVDQAAPAVPSSPAATTATRLVVTVIDSGRGMNDAQLERLFKPYERLSAARLGIPGTGLGLANARQLLEAMGGSIDVTSFEGEGSRFDLRWPALAPEAGECAQPADELADATKALDAGDATARGPATPALRGRIAYVEDEPVNALLMQAMLQRHEQLELVVFPTGAAALGAARHEVFDLWLLDLDLPDIGGIDLFRQLATVRRAGAADLNLGADTTPRVVIVSADATDAAREMALAAGCLDFWVKPLDRNRLDADLARMLHPAPMAPAARQPAEAP